MDNKFATVARQHGVQALVGVGLLLVGLVGGVVLAGHMTAQAAAGTPSQPAVTGQGAQKYCQVYENALASKLGISTATLEADNLAAIQKTLDAMVADQQITGFEESQVLALAQQIGAQPCTHLTLQSVTSFLSGDAAVIAPVLAARAALVSAVATSLGITTATLQTDLAHGQTVAQIAQARKVALATVRAAYLKAAQTQLAQAVSEGLITQVQADALAKVLQAAVGKGAFPLLTLGGLGGLGG